MLEDRLQWTWGLPICIQSLSQQNSSQLTAERIAQSIISVAQAMTPEISETMHLWPDSSLQPHDRKARAEAISHGHLPRMQIL